MRRHPSPAAGPVTPELDFRVTLESHCPGEVGPIHEQLARTRILSDDEYERLQPLIRESGSANLYAVVVAALSSGAREGELPSLQWTDDHDLRRGTWQATTGVSIPWLQLFSGHRTSAQLDKYIHLAKTRTSDLADLYQHRVDQVA